ncbi:MAG: hypothetical protein K0S33_1887 [Bacteroidetes bacterium]|jgi:hypothetical protein|nr:hypothetical protein [Bacteroidota bacterium]
MSNKAKAVLGLSLLTPEAKVTRAQGIKNDMMASTLYPDAQLPVGYVSMQTLIDNLHHAIVATNSGTAANTSDMHEKERMLVTAFNLIKAHVEYVANQNINAETYITSAGMQVMQNGGGSPVSELTLDAPGNGVVIIRVPRGTGEKAFVYEMSTDNTSFTKVTSSTLAKITISGQQAGSTLYVRFYPISNEGEGPLSQAKSIMVV